MYRNLKSHRSCPSREVAEITGRRAWPGKEHRHRIRRNRRSLPFPAKMRRQTIGCGFGAGMRIVCHRGQLGQYSVPMFGTRTPCFDDHGLLERVSQRGWSIRQHVVHIRWIRHDIVTVLEGNDLVPTHRGKGARRRYAAGRRAGVFKMRLARLLLGDPCGYPRAEHVLDSKFD